VEERGVHPLKVMFVMLLIIWIISLILR